MTGGLWRAVRGAALAIAAMMAAAPAAAQDQPMVLPTAKELGAKPFLNGPKLSPDGTRYVARANVKGVVRLAVVTIGTGAKPDVHTFGLPKKQSLSWYRWAGNNRLLVGLRYTALFQEDEYPVTRIAVLDLTTGKTQALTLPVMGFLGDDVIHVDRAGEFALVSVQPTPYDYPAVYRFELATGRPRRVVDSADHVWNWFADANGVVRGGVGTDDGKWWILYRQAEKAPFKSSKPRDFKSNIQFFYAAIGADSGYAVALAEHGRYALRRYDFLTDTLGEVVWKNDRYDVDDIEVDRNGVPVAIHYTDDRPRIDWLDPELRRYQAAFDKAVPGSINRIISMSADASRMIVLSGSAIEAPVYALFDKPRNAFDVLVMPYSEVAGRRLAPMESVSFKARDGLEIPAYLTLPLDKPAKGLPLIVMPHGGPFVRDEWGYDPWVQFLAAKGYAVLQPNYRGSTGYGIDYVQKGFGQWGRGMQDDIDDGVKWLIASGKVDAKRVCIMGASFGGYAAMWGAVRNPDLYRCAISFAGISDVAAMLRYDRDQSGASRYFRDWRSRVQGDRSFNLDQVSALKAVDRLTIPILIAHGSDDDNVPVSQSRKLHDALTRAGKAHDYVIYPDEGHGLNIEANSIDFLERVGRFLDQHNPAS